MSVNSLIVSISVKINLLVFPTEGVIITSSFLRLVFFIYKNDGKILCTPYGEFSIENPKKLPKRLKRIVEFENPD